MTCPRCGTENPEGAGFCSNCDRALMDRSQAAEPLAEPLLVWKADDGSKRQISLRRTVTIGRSGANDIPIQDSAISRQHTRIEVMGGDFLAVDLGSLNGTYVNDERIEEPQSLNDGDLVRVGGTAFTAVIPEPSEMQEAQTVALQSPFAVGPADVGEDEGSSEPTMFMPNAAAAMARDEDERTVLADAEEAELSAAEAESFAVASDDDDEQPYLTEAEARPDEFAAQDEFGEPEDQVMLSDSDEEAAIGQGAGTQEPIYAADEEPSGEDERTVMAPLFSMDADAEPTPEAAAPPSPAVGEAAEEPAAEEPKEVGYLVFGETRIPLYSSLSVGRAEGVDIRIDDDRTVSRNHARIEVRFDGVYLVDNNSANGTFLENEKVTGAVRIEGDAIIRFGQTPFRFEAAQAAPPPAELEPEPDFAPPASDETVIAATPGSNTEPVRAVRSDYDSSATMEAVASEEQTLRGDSFGLEPGPDAGTPAVIEGGGASPDQYRLIVNFGADAGSAFPLAGDATVIGRVSPEADYDVQLNDRAVSRPHAKVLRQGDGYAIQDLESANGTWLNYTEEVSGTRTLADGDIVKMGKTTLVYRVPAAIRPAPPEIVLDPNIGQIISAFSLKGGVGTTTLAVNLAVLLRRLTVEPVLLVDLATEQGAVSVQMNVTPRVTLADLPSDPSIIDAHVLQSLVTHHPSGVDVLPAPPSPQTAELVSPAAVSSILPILRAHYRWIVIDTSATFSELNLGVLDQSDLLLLAFAPDLSSLKVMQSTLDVLSALQTPAEKRVLVLNQVYPKPHLQPSEIEHTLGERIGLTLPYAEEALLDTIDKGIPLAIDQATHPTVAAIESFASKLAQINLEASQRPQRGGFGRWVQGIVSGLRR